MTIVYFRALRPSTFNMTPYFQQNEQPVKAKQNVKKCESSLGTVPNKEKPNLIEDMITNKIICRDPEQEKRIARIKETKAEHERKRKVMQVRF